MQEELQKSLAAAFNLTASQINEANGRGYRIHIHAPWPRQSSGVKYYLVQLCGKNPLNGEDIESQNISAKFTFDNEKEKTKILAYHGQFYLRCTAVFSDGRTVPFKEQDISLNFPQNSPYVEHTVRNAGDFKLVEIRSNCWENCDGKIWLRFEGHEQLVTQRGGPGQPLRVYVPATGDVSLVVRDELIRVKGGW